MRVIYKYELILERDPFQGYRYRARVFMPQGAKILHVHSQGDDAFVWAIVETKNKLIERYFRVVMTGQETDVSEMKYIGTIHIEDGAYVLHVFYI